MNATCFSLCLLHLTPQIGDEDKGMPTIFFSVLALALAATWPAPVAAGKKSKKK